MINYEITQPVTVILLPAQVIRKQIKQEWR